MTFSMNRERIKALLVNCGIKEIANSKAHIPNQFPAGIVSLVKRRGVNPVSSGFADQKFRFEIFVIVKESETADEEILQIIESVDNRLYEEQLFTEVESVVFYWNMLKASDIRVARFELEV